MDTLSNTAQGADIQPVQRRRGRPKGSTKKALDPGMIAQSPNTPGRSRRAKTETHNYNVKESFEEAMRLRDEVTEATTEKVERRGRPKGTKDKPSTGKAKPIISTRKPGERRGRPLGLKNKATILKEELAAAQGTPLGTEKRKRGRPRKTPVEEGTPASSTATQPKRAKKMGKSPILRRNFGGVLPTIEKPNKIPDTFSKFSQLPHEVQEMIWFLAMETCEGTPNLLEAKYVDQPQHRFVTSGPAASILQVWGSSKIPHMVKPLYLVPTMLADHYSSWSVAADPIFFRPEHDILYIPMLEDLDIDKFLARSENQALQYLAITRSAAKSLGFLGTTDVSQTAAHLVSGLKGLKTLYILDGEITGSEDKVNGGNDYTIQLEELKLGEFELAPSAWSPDGSFIAALPVWNTGYFEIMKGDIDRAIERISHTESRIRLQIVAREVKRTLVFDREQTVDEEPRDFEALWYD